MVFTTVLAAGTATAQTTSILSVGPDGELPDCSSGGLVCAAFAPSVTPDGRYVTYTSNVPNLVPGPATEPLQIFRHDRLTCSTVRISETSDGQPGSSSSDDPSISADGEVIAFDSSATNFVPGVPAFVDQTYVYDESTASIRLVSQSPDGVPGNDHSGNPAISADGRWIVFVSWA